MNRFDSKGFPAAGPGSPVRTDHKVSLLIVHKAFGTRWSGRVHAGPVIIPCALGRSGIRSAKREGDHAKPRGCFALTGVLYRKVRPLAPLPVKRIKPEDGWCDDRNARQYNRPIRLPAREGHERLYRDDQVYDVVITLDHNQSPRVRGHGSAIFFHLARPGYSPTEGCVAISDEDMRRLVPRLGRQVRMRIV